MSNYAARLQDAQAQADNDRADRSPPPLMRIIEAFFSPANNRSPPRRLAPSSAI